MYIDVNLQTIHLSTYHHLHQRTLGHLVVLHRLQFYHKYKHTSPEIDRLAQYNEKDSPYNRNMTLQWTTTYPAPFRHPGSNQSIFVFLAHVLGDEDKDMKVLSKLDQRGTLWFAEAKNQSPVHLDENTNNRNVGRSIHNGKFPIFLRSWIFGQT